MTNYLQNAGPAPSPIGQMAPNDGMPGGPMPPTFFPVSFYTFYNIELCFNTIRFPRSALAEYTEEEKGHWCSS